MSWSDMVREYQHLGLSQSEAIARVVAERQDAERAAVAERSDAPEVLPSDRELEHAGQLLLTEQLLTENVA